MRIAIGSIKHESNTNATHRTSLENFKREQFLIGNEVVEYHRNRKTEMGGFLSVVQPGNEIIPTISVNAVSSGIVEKEAFLFIYEKLLSILSGKEFDAIFLSLHGAMCVESIEDPEGYLLKNLRKKYPEVIIGCTLDHHANVSEEMVENTDFLVSFRTHPHIDQYETGVRAGKLMGMKNIKELKKTLVRLPLITPAENQSKPIMTLKEHTDKLCERSDVASASFNVGYPWADVSIMGSSIYVIHKKEFPHYLIEEFSQLFWSLRDDFQFPIRPLSYLEVLNERKSEKPFVLNEISDCIFGGSSGDVVTTTAWLHKNCDSPSIVVGIVDKEAIEKAFSLGVGNEGDFLIGGKICTKGNPPLRVHAIVLLLTKDIEPKSVMSMEEGRITSRIAIIRSKAVDIILVEYPCHVGGAALFEPLGLSASDYKFIVVKEGLNPFITYKNICEEIIMMESPGFNPQKLAPEMYENIKRKTYPMYEVGLDEKIVKTY